MAFLRSTYPMPKKRGTRAKKKKKRTNQNLIKFSFFRQKLLLLKRGKIGVRRSFLLLLIYLFLLSRDLIHLESSIYLLMSRLNFIISSLTSFALKVLPFFLIVRRCYCYQIWWSKNSHKSTDYEDKHTKLIWRKMWKLLIFPPQQSLFSKIPSKQLFYESEFTKFFQSLNKFLKTTKLRIFRIGKCKLVFHYVVMRVCPKSLHRKVAYSTSK